MIPSKVNCYSIYGKSSKILMEVRLLSLMPAIFVFRRHFFGGIEGTVGLWSFAVERHLKKILIVTTRNNSLIA